MVDPKEFKLSKKIIIDGVKTCQLKPIFDERGFLMEMLRSDDEHFKHFGQTYLTAVNEGVVKAWHYHENQTDTFICVYGMIKLVLFDSREESPTGGVINEFFIGDKNPQRVQIPTKVMHGFKGISQGYSLIINIPNQLYNYQKPDEYRIDAHSTDIPYDWARKDG